jgi:hypothetical protein
MVNHPQPLCTNPIFIVGTQRAGTTLLRLMLNAHAEIAVPEEARFLTPLLERRYVDRELRGRELENVVRYVVDNPQLELWNYDAEPFRKRALELESVQVRDLIDAMYSSFAASEGKRIWGDKSLFFRQVDALHAMFPGARFVHIVRDGRDVFASWRKIDPTKDHVAVIALDWRIKLAAIERSFARLPESSQLTIRYEDLIDDPQPLLGSLCAFIGVDYDQGMLEFHRTSHRYIGDHHSELIFEPINKSNASKWRRTLTAREARIFSALARGALERYGYPGLDDRIGAGDCAALAGDLLVGLPARAWQVLRTKHLMNRGVQRGRASESLELGSMPSEPRRRQQGGDDR